MPDRYSPPLPAAGRGSAIDPEQSAERFKTMATTLGLDDPLGVGHGSLVADSGSGLSPSPFYDTFEDMLARVFRGKGLREGLRLTSGDPGTGNVRFHSVDSGRPYEMPMNELQKSLRSGAMREEGVPTEGLQLSTLVRRLLGMIKE